MKCTFVTHRWRGRLTFCKKPASEWVGPDGRPTTTQPMRIVCKAHVA